ncbi:MAG: ADP-ribosylglycohydrolase family protein [Pseudomonadota bacterium]
MMGPIRNPTDDDIRDRAMGALLGLAIGDALGMPTQTLSPVEIRARYGPIRSFLAPFAEHPVSHGLPAGAVTDDTEQALLLARRLLSYATEAGPADGRLSGWDDRAWAADLLAWEEGVRARGLRDLLGPSTKRAIDALLAGADPSAAGRHGTTNGAAMRIAPVGIATPPDPPAALVARVAQTARLTHATAPAIAAASAVAAAISAGIAGADWATARAAACTAARLGALAGRWCDGGDVATRIAAACSAADPAALCGTGVQAAQSVPCAFGLAEAAQGDAWQAACRAAELGGDTDTIGAIAGALCGACSGASALPGEAVAEITRINQLDLDPLVDGLLTLRRATERAWA